MMCEIAKCFLSDTRGGAPQGCESPSKAVVYDLSWVSRVLHGARRHGRASSPEVSLPQARKALCLLRGLLACRGVPREEPTARLWQGGRAEQPHLRAPKGSGRRERARRTQPPLARRSRAG